MERIVGISVELNPKRVLEIGPGHGKYGCLLMEYTSATVDAVEVFEPYVRDFKLKAKYDRVTVGNGLEADLSGYDLVLLIDVIEHWEKPDGLAFLRRATEGGATVLVSTPRGFFPQGAVNGNEWETHRSAWNSPDLDGLRFDDRSTQDSFVWIFRPSDANP